MIAVLATLLMTALANGKKRSRRIVCTGNLRQISLALSMYLDDYPKRPPGYEFLTSDKYLPARKVLLCPEDKTGNWGGIVQSGFGLPAGIQTGADLKRDESTAERGPEPVPYSFLHPLPWEDWAWNALVEQGFSAGISACQLHGLGRPDPEMPTVYDYEGLVLRARRDGAVIHKQVYWGSLVQRQASAPATSPNDAFASGLAGNRAATPTLSGQAYPWQLFTDEPLSSGTDAVPTP
jgi:hypothetical protein